MAYNVNLNITSAVGFRRSSTQTYVNYLGTPTIGGLNGPRPVMTTTFTLNGVEQPDIAITGTRILNVTTTTDFIFYPGTTSTKQTIYITNKGNSPLSIVSPYFFLTNNGVTPRITFQAPINNLTVTSSGTTGTYVISPISVGTLTVYYSGTELGEFYNYIMVITDADSPNYKILTKQIVQNEFQYNVSTSSFTTSTTVFGFKTTATYVINPIFNDVVRPDLIVPLSASLSTTTTGWSIIENERNTIKVLFNGNSINNATGTYISTLTVSDGVLSYELTNTANVNINYAENYNLGAWLSAPSRYDSIIGISYDVIGGIRYITIGVGLNGDGAPLYGFDGVSFLSLENINYIGGGRDTPYEFWGKVFRIPIVNTVNNSPATYFSKEYLVKNQGPEYVSYFGENQAPGSMFIIEDDGYHNLTIKMNHLRAVPSDGIDSVTVQNLTRAFYYYSNVDIGGGRYYNLEPILEDGKSTSFFVGFNNLGQVIKYPVPLPSL